MYNHFANALLEGINDKIKILKRNSYDYHKYSYFRNRILLICKLYVSYTASSTPQIA
ncbi:transposase [Gemella sp. zg-570]|uniref:transposase n=1 Tax=unclassified Gemella TaxID=2624949 RepID=UPI001C04899F|nr:transposase [Gemella sp. zg-570]MBU0278452.1 transposase [Gemella sp. zg-1178]QWQ39494.1 transposase [Gemella sp. zg-570]